MITLAVASLALAKLTSTEPNSSGMVESHTADVKITRKGVRIDLYDGAALVNGDDIAVAGGELTYHCLVGGKTESIKTSRKFACGTGVPPNPGRTIPKPGTLGPHHKEAPDSLKIAMAERPAYWINVIPDGVQLEKDAGETGYDVFKVLQNMDSKTPEFTQNLVLARVYATNKDYSMALEHLQKVPADRVSAATLVDKGDLYLALKDYVHAESCYADAAAKAEVEGMETVAVVARQSLAIARLGQEKPQGLEDWVRSVESLKKLMDHNKINKVDKIDRDFSKTKIDGLNIKDIQKLEKLNQGLGSRGGD